MDDVPVEKVREFESNLYKYADLHDEVLKLIDDRKALDEEIEKKMTDLVKDYKLSLRLFT